MSLDFRCEPIEAPFVATYPQGVARNLRYPRGPIWWLLEEAARKHPDRVAIRYYEEELTYKRLHESARRGAAVLAELGIRPGDRVGVLLPNCPDHMVAVYAIWMAGGVVVSLSPLMVAEEISALLGATNCRTVISLDLLTPLACNGGAELDHLLLVSIKENLSRFKRLGYELARLKRNGLRTTCNRATVHLFAGERARAAPLERPIESSGDTVAFILSTGGTTGNPKAVKLTHRNLTANAWQLCHWAGFPGEKESVLAVLPFFHSYGMSACVTAGVAMAASLILHHRFEPRTVLELIERHRPTIFHAVPMMLIALNEKLREKPADLTSLKWCISGGAPLDPAVAAEFAKHSGALVVEGYGLSEAGPVTHVGPLDGTARPGTIGLPLPDTEARIVDLKTGRRTVPRGEVGELLIRGPQVMAGYWNNPRETARVLRNGWLHTGDIATCDSDGFYRIVDRKKDLIITSGMNVYPADVEDVVRQFAGIADVAVLGVPDDRHGEIVKAVLVLERGQRFNRKAFDRFTKEHLSKHKRPRIVEVIDGDLPRNFLGKVLRRKLRDDSAIGPAGPYANEKTPVSVSE